MKFSATHLFRGCITLMVALLIFTIGRGSAQSLTDDVYGGNPFEVEQDGDGERPAEPPKDSLKSKKEKMPLESYFFSDSLRALKNIKWFVNRDYNEVKFQSIDTTLVDWRIDYPVLKDGVGDMMLGGLGQASQAIDFSQRADPFNFSFSQPYSSYIFTMENAPFYNTKKIFTQLQYIEAGQSSYRETNFQIRHAQNITPSTGFSIDYKSPGTKGKYQRQDTKNHNLALTFSHTGKRYSVHAGYLNNRIETEESGGVVGEWAIIDSLFEMPVGVPMKLENAEATNVYRNKSFFVEQSYGIPLEPMSDYDFSMANLSAIYFCHSFEYNRWTKTYSDIYATYTNDRDSRNEDGTWNSAVGSYYDNWYINPNTTRDSLSESVISNRFFIQAQPWGRYGMLGTLNAGVGIDFHTYSQFSMDDYLSGEMAKVHETSLFVYGKIDGRLRDYINWGANVKVYPAGYRGGDLEAGANITLSANIAGKKWILDGEVSTERRSASYWEQNLFSNHYAWNNNFSAESESQIKASLSIPECNFELGITQSVLSDKIYYDTDCIVTQSTDMVSVTGAYLHKDFKIAGFNFGHRVLWQMSSNSEVVTVPTVSAYLSYYYEFWIVKNVLRLQTGVDGRYTSKYYMPSYNPALSTFYNQRDREGGGYPYMDVYAAAKWKRMRILLKYQHLNQGLFGNDDYFAVEGYPLNPGMFKMGISWSFYD
ncbi:MAG: putative porin [Rikenellaceae bacterium]